MKKKFAQQTHWKPYLDMSHKMKNGIVRTMTRRRVAASKAIVVVLSTLNHLKVSSKHQHNSFSGNFLQNIVFLFLFRIDCYIWTPSTDGWTRDNKETNMKLVNQVEPRIGSAVRAIITCIVNADNFYVNLPQEVATFGATLESLKRNINDPEMVDQYRKVRDFPGTKKVG